MASQALYRRWRSQTFDELVGQEHVVQTLRQAIRTGRIGHAYLFTGPRGVGKTTVARLLAKAVNCEAPLEQRPCDQCAMCRAIAEGRAVDVIEMDAASHTSVEDAREIIERVQFRPAIARTKVYVIDETHMLSTAAFNALLKTLEEPPAHALFILATTEVHKVPETIASRCQRFLFARHGVTQIAEHLQHIAQNEHVTLEPSAAERIARAATGSMRDAISLFDQLIAGSNGTVTLSDVHNLLGSTETGRVAALVDALLTADLQLALQRINEVADSGADLRQFARDVVEWLRALLHLSAGNDPTLLDLPAETVQELQAQVSQTDIGQLVAWLKLFSTLDYQLKNSPYGQLPLELAAVEALVTPAALATAVTRPAATPRPVRSAPTPAPVAHRPSSSSQRTKKEQAANEPVQTQPVDTTPPTVPVEETPSWAPEEPLPAPASGDGRSEHVIEVVDDAAFLLEDVEACWSQVVEDIRARNRVVYAGLEGVKPINVEERTIVLLAKHEWQKSKLEIEKTRRLIERELSKALENTCGVRVTVDQREEMPDEKKQLQHVHKDERVRSAMNVFDATIVAIDKL